MNRISNYCEDNLEMLFNNKNLKNKFMKFNAYNKDI